MLVNVGTFIGEPSGSKFSAYGFRFTAPVLAWLTDATDNTPVFSEDIDPAALSTDYNHTQVSASSDFAVIAQEVTTTVALIESSLGLSALADGIWYIRVRLERPSGTAASNWSNTLTLTIATSSYGGITYQLLFAA